MSIGMKWLIWFLVVGGCAAVIALTSCTGNVHTPQSGNEDMIVANDLVVPSPDLRLTCGGGIACIRNCADQPCVDACVARSDNDAELATWVKCVEGYCGQPIYQIMPADRCMQDQFQFARACWCHYYQCQGVTHVRDMGVAENCQ